MTNPATLLDSGVTNVKVIAGQLNGGSNIIIRKGVTANTWKDLEGKTIGVTPGTYARIEFIISHDIKAHPLALLRPEAIASRKERTAIERVTRDWPSPAEYFVTQLASGVARIAAAQDDLDAAHHGAGTGSTNDAVVGVGLRLDAQMSFDAGDRVDDNALAGHG